MDKKKTIMGIINGEADRWLENIYQAYIERRKWLRDKKGMEVKASLKVGDKVVFNNKIHPRYLSGIQAEVIGFNQKRIQLIIDENIQARRFSSSQVNCPADYLEKV